MLDFPALREEIPRVAQAARIPDADGRGMAKTLLWAPVRVVAGPGACGGVADDVARLGGRAFILGGRCALLAAVDVVAQLRARLASVAVQRFVGECSATAVDAATDGARGFDVVVGIGGGKAIDTAKAAADVLQAPCVAIPTSPATCAAYTPLSILHTDRGEYVESRRLRQSVSLLMLDPTLMTACPPRLLASGMVDAFARFADASLASRATSLSFPATASLAISRGCVDEVLIPLGERALGDLARHTATADFERVVDACILGAGLAGETGARFFGRGLSHAVGYALADVLGSHDLLHGESVGLGVLVQSAIDPAGAFSLSQLRTLFRSWGAPASFRDVGVDLADKRTSRRLADRTLAHLDLERAVPFGVRAEQLQQAFHALENGVK